MWCFCKIGFYTFQGFQGYKICNFWTSRTFYMDFTSCSIFERFLNLFDFRQATWRYPICRYRFSFRTNKDPWICIKQTVQIGRWLELTGVDWVWPMGKEAAAVAVVSSSTWWLLGSQRSRRGCTGCWAARWGGMQGRRLPGWSPAVAKGGRKSYGQRRLGKSLVGVLCHTNRTEEGR
jgi:hypothetical protein